MRSLILVAVIGVSCVGKQNGVSNPVFDKDIEPIIVQHCTPCHRENGGAPFVLTSFEAVKKKAKTIAKVTENRIMPPWPADPNYTHFLKENILSDEQIATIQNWVEQGSKPGKNPGRLLSKVTPFVSNLGTPDMVLELDTVTLNQGDQDRFFLVKTSGRMPQKKYVRAVEFIPGQPQLVHHFNGHLINYEKGSKRDFTTQPLKVEMKYEESKPVNKDLNLMTSNGIIPERVHSVVNYLPGVFGTEYPDGIGTFQLSEEFSIVGNDVHYGPSRKTVVDKSKIHLFFTETPPSRGLGELMLGTNGVSKIVPPLVIKPNTVSKHVTQFTVPADISVLTVNPHLHLLGISFKAYAIKPNGDTIRLISIPRWDFRWQYFYTFPTMVKIPRGSIIRAEAVFDNTDNNPNNPNRPPKTVAERFDYGGSSMRASDEMFQFIITYVAWQPGDEKISLKK